MKTIVGNVWHTHGDWICIPTNGVVKADGAATMGAGCAKEASQRLGTDLAYRLGELIAEQGNHVYYLGEYAEQRIYSFPTKHHWRDPSDLALIEQSAIELRQRWIDWQKMFYSVPEVLIPRPGCGYGGLTWQSVKPVLESVLVEDAFRIIAFTPADFR